MFDGPADIQDGGEETSRDTEGRLVVRSIAVMFLDPEEAAHDHVVGDVGTGTWEDGSTDDAEIVNIRRIDGRMELKWL